MFNVFPYVFQTTFQTTFNTIINTRDMIDNIVDSVFNNEAFNNMLGNIEERVSLNLNCSENDREYLITGRLPGISKRDIDIDYTNNYLTITVKRNQFFSNGSNISVAIIQGGQDFVQDYYVGNVDPYSIKAVFKNEVLDVHVPKKNKIEDHATIIDVKYEVQ